MRKGKSKIPDLPAIAEPRKYQKGTRFAPRIAGLHPEPYIKGLMLYEAGVKPRRKGFSLHKTYKYKINTFT